VTGHQPLGPVLHSFFADHLITVKGLRPASVRSYRDTIRLLLVFAAADKGCKITRLSLDDLTYDRVVRFLRHLEHDRGNHVRTGNQRLAVLHVLFDYIAGRSPEMLAACQQVAAIPMKRAAPPETRFLERDEVAALLAGLPASGRLALRDRALVLFRTTAVSAPAGHPENCGTPSSASCPTATSPWRRSPGSSATPAARSPKPSTATSSAPS
jgi:integrase/recombinase XerD